MNSRPIIIGIHPDRAGKESYSEKWEEALRARGAEVRRLNLFAPDALEQARPCDGVMWRWLHDPQHKQSAKTILAAIEKYLGIPVYPDWFTAWHFDEKITQFYLLQALQAPLPRTWLFWDRESALAWAQEAAYPVVFKLSSGAGASNVLKVDAQSQAIGLINRAFRRGIFPYTLNEYRPARGIPRSPSEFQTQLYRVADALRYIWTGDFPRLHPTHWKPEFGYAYFQEFLHHNSFDTRISVIGDRAFGFRRMNRPGDFRASGSGMIDTDPAQIDPRCLEIAFRISRQGRFQSMSYDFLYRQDRPMICEISYGYADWAVHQCPGHWDFKMKWVEGHMWPEEAQVADFLEGVTRSQQSSAKFPTNQIPE